MGRPKWFDGVGDFYGVLSARRAVVLGLPGTDRVVRAEDVSPAGVARHVFDALTNEHLGSHVSVRMVGAELRRHRRLARRCRQVQRARRKDRRARRRWR
jgi:hypothetical protein